MLLATNPEVKVTDPGQIHSMYFTDDNLMTGKYGVFDYKECIKQQTVDLNEYTTVCILRNPYHRFIAGFAQQAKLIVRDGRYKGRFDDMNASRFLAYLRKDISVTGHFLPQTQDLLPLDFEFIIDVSEMNRLHELLGLASPKRIDKHRTSYGANACFREMTISEIAKRRVDKKPFSNKIEDWLSEGDIENLESLYRRDFKFAKKNGISYDRDGYTRHDN